MKLIEICEPKSEMRINNSVQSTSIFEERHKFEQKNEENSIFMKINNI